MSTLRFDAVSPPHVKAGIPAFPSVLERIDTRWQVGIVAVLAVYFMVWPAWRLGFPIEIDLNEGFNAYLADAAMGAGPLYPPSDTLTVNNYPPLSFYAVGWLAQVFGDALYVGRVLSLLAVLAVGALIGAVVRQLGGGKTGAAVGGLWFIAVMARSFSRYVGMDDPQLAAHALMMGALVWFMVRQAHRQSVVPAIVAMVAAGFFKHNIVAVPVTALVWLALKDWRRAVAPAVIGAGAAAAGFAICIAVWGDAFLANFFTPRINEAMRAAGALGRTQFILPALVMWGIWAAAEPKSPSARFSMLFIAVGFLFFVLQSAGDGVDDNAQFDLVIAAAVGLGLAFDRAGRTAFGRRHGATAAQAVVVLVVALRLVATLRIEPALVLFSPDYRAEYFANAQLIREEAAQVAQIPGPVACDTRLVCRLAGKPFSFDPFRANTMVKTGASGGLDIDGLIRARGMTRFGGAPSDAIPVLYRSIAGKP